MFSYATSCLPLKKNYLSSMTGKEKHEYWAKILQFDSKSDFYGYYKHMMYSLVAVREGFIILTRLWKVTLTQMKRKRRICMRIVWITTTATCENRRAAAFIHCRGTNEKKKKNNVKWIEQAISSNHITVYINYLDF